MSVVGNPSSFGSSTEIEDHLWDSFVRASTSDDLAKAWLGLLCLQLKNVSVGVVLMEAATSNTFVPVAVYPVPTKDLAQVAKIAERALTEATGIVLRDEHSSGLQVAYPIQTPQRVIGAVALSLSSAENERHLLRQLHWGMAWLRDLFLQRELHLAESRGRIIGSVMEAVAVGLRPHKLQQTLFELCNHLARELRCERVGIGLAQGKSIRLRALSDSAWVEKSSTLSKCYVAAMEEAADEHAALAYASHKDGAAQGRSFSRQRDLAQQTGAFAVRSVPLIDGLACVGVISFERGGEAATDFTEEDVRWIDALVALLPAMIDQRQRAERGHLGRFRDEFSSLGRRLLGPGYLTWKVAAIGCVMVVGLLVLVRLDYRVTAKTVIEGEVQRVAAAPFEGFIAHSYVRAGDTVQMGQVLCELDDHDLQVEQAKWLSEREQDDKKLREATSGRNFSEAAIASAQLKQAEAQLTLATERIKRARITAPFDGVIVSGDLSQLAGSPVEQGKKLFEIAPLESYRVILQVDEREIRHVEIGQPGRLVISGTASESPMPFTVAKVTPVATAEDGRNFFRVEARLEQGSPRLRPGMEGVGKINVGERNLGWILSHSSVDWLRLKLWSWML